MGPRAGSSGPRLGVLEADRLFFASLIPAAVALLGILVALAYVLVGSSLPAVKRYGLELFFEACWNPEHEAYGLLAPLLGTVEVSLVALAVALVLGVPAALAVAEYLQGRTRELFSSLLELMGGVPTVIYGLWGAKYVAPLIRDWLAKPLHDHLGFLPIFSCYTYTGYSVLTAGVVLGISTVPYVASMVLEAYKSIPEAYREACLGIGATRSETMLVMLAIARPAVLAAALLGLARAMGETTIVALTVGNSMNIPCCLFAPSYTVSALIANQFGNAYLHRYAGPVLYTGALVVFAASLAMSFTALKMLERWRERIRV